MSNYGGFHGGFSHNGPKKAKNPCNQAALDKLRAMVQEPKYANNAHYPRVFRQGMSSLAKAAGEIRTVDDAIGLSNVGQFLAKIIAAAAREAHGGGEEEDANAGAGEEDRPSSRGSNTTDNGGRKRKKATQQLSIVPPSAVGAVAVAVPAKKKRARKATAASSTASVSDPAKPSAKQTAYARAVRESEGLSATLDQYGDWRVILLVDTREQKADHMTAKLLMSGIDAEIRQLPIGDMLWIARGERKRITPNSGLGLGGAAEKQIIEVILGTVVERKTLEDLTSSLFGTRFEEQRLRLKNSAAGANQVLYLVEAEKVTDLPNCSGSTLRYAMMQTQIHLGFAVVRTKGIDDTIRYLRRVHRRLMRRSFPTEFNSAEFDGVGTGRAVPTFASPDGRVRQDDRARGRVEMVFQNPPAPFEARRHTLYEEFKAKIELVRETGTRSVKALHSAMLKQVDSWAIAKVHALTNRYDTPSSLARAFRDALARGGLDEADSMVRDISTGKSSARARRIGPKSSSELAKVYLAGVDEEDYVEKEDNVALKSGGGEGDRLVSSVVPVDDTAEVVESIPTAATAPASAPAPAATTSSRSAGVASLKKKCSYGDCSDLSSDDDNDANERATRRRKKDEEDLNRKPAALSREQLAETRGGEYSLSPSTAAKKMPSIQYDYELSSDSDDEGGRLNGGGEEDDDNMQRAINASLQSLSAEKSKRKETSTVPAARKIKSKADCFDLTMDSSEDDDDDSSDDDKSTRVGKLSPINEHASAAASGRPRLSHDGVGSGKNSSNEEEIDGASDSESSCDELVVRLRNKAAANGEKVRLYDSTNTSTASSRIDADTAGGRRKQQPSSQTQGRFFPSSASSTESPEEGQEKDRQESSQPSDSDDDDIEIIELSD